MSTLTVECQVHFRRGERARKRMLPGVAPESEAIEPGRVPRVARLMALAIRMQRLLREGVVRDYADLARLGGVTRARVTQIMNLLLLAPDIQEEVLFLPRTREGRHPISERDLRPVAAMAAWSGQRRMMQALRRGALRYREDRFL